MSDSRKKEDFEYIIKISRTHGLFDGKKIILLDEADGIENFRYVNELLKNTKVPVVMTANEIWRIPEFIQNKCEVIKLYPPSKREIVEYLRRKFGDNIHFDKIIDDVRQSIIAAIYGSDPYSETNIFKEVKNIFLGRNFEFTDYAMWFYILDNLDKFYRGKKLFDAIMVLCNASLYDKPELLKFMPKTTKTRAEVEPSYYLKRKKIIEEERR